MLHIKKNLSGLKAGSLLMAVISVGIAGCNESETSNTNSSTTMPTASLKSTAYSLTSATPINTAAIDYAADSETMTKLGLSLSDQTLGLADMIGKFALKKAPQRREDITCGNGGALAWRWSDNDNDSKISAGDLATVSLKECSILSNNYRGVLQIHFISPEKASNTIAFSAQVKIQEFNDKYKKWLSINGLFNSRLTLSNDQFNVRLELADNGLVFSKLSASQRVTLEEIKNSSIVREMDLINANYRLNLAGTVDSGLMQEVFSFSTGKTLEGSLNTYPEQGFLIFKSKNLFSRVQATSSTNREGFNFRATYQYDARGIGNINSGIKYLEWKSLFNNGFLFYDTLIWDIGSYFYNNHLITSGFGDTFKLIGIYADDGSYDPHSSSIDAYREELKSRNASLIYQFSRPLNKDTLKKFTLEYRPYKDNLTSLVDMSVTVSGAKIIFSPTKVLQEGYYELKYDGYQVEDISGIYKASGLSQRFMTSYDLPLKTSFSSQIAKPGKLIRLNALSSGYFGNLPLAYKWRQIEGTQVDIVNSDSKDAYFISPEINKDNDVLKFEVTIILNDGSMQKSVIPIYIYKREEDFVLLDFVSEKGADVGHNIAQSFMRDMRLQIVNIDNSGFGLDVLDSKFQWNLQIRPYNGLQTGFYDNVITYPGNQGKNALSFSWGGASCRTVAGSFTIYEIAFDATGQISRLAADFVRQCEARESPLTGRIRYHTVTNM